ncbi:MAG: arginine--tRNA ligase [Bacteroidota bacterium]|jgi:arginyl-tRNA synthetase|nr:arginine--tRNA ligase [Bacteroidota bacterium]
MNVEHFLASFISQVINELFGLAIQPEEITLQKTKKEFEGDYTLVTFPYIKASKCSPEITGERIGEKLLSTNPSIIKFNVVKGFLNLSLSNDFWLSEFKHICAQSNYGIKPEKSSGKQIMLEYSSPNTNKPLHLGHVRNNLLGYSVATILKTQGHDVIKVNLINDRGIHICKSMIAWKLFGNGETPESSGLKGDHLVGKYYVEFDRAYKKEIQHLIDNGTSKEEAEKKAPIMLKTQEMLQKWEAHDQEIISLWKMMNGWVYEGFAISYKKLGVEFDKMYYESNTYLLGKEAVQEGLSKKVFYKKMDNSVAIDLTADKLDEKIVLRSDGTSVYITQDLGTAIERFKEFPHISQMIYTVGNEQDYHFKVLFKILEKLGYQWAKECYHLSYGMVELPEGKMKSREGTVVDADDLMDGMIETAKETTESSGKVSDFSNEEKEKLFHTIGMGALKYFILKVDPKKKMLFDPKESIDLHGNTGPFIQYAHARIKSILRDSKTDINGLNVHDGLTLHEKEKELIKLQYDFPKILSEAANTYNPAVVANYIYDLARLFNQFYNECSVLKEPDLKIQTFRIKLIATTAAIIKNGMNCLGIEVPEKM